MKTRRFSQRGRSVLFAPLSIALAASASAQLTWEPVSPAGDGAWDLVADNWDSGSDTYVVWDNSGNTEAVFPDYGSDYTVTVGDSGVTVGDLTYNGAGRLILEALTDNVGRIAIKSGGATWNTGGAEIEFNNFNDGTLNDLGLDIDSGDTLTVSGGGVFDAGESPNGANWDADGATLDFTSATELRGDVTTTGQFLTVQLPGASTFTYGRNSNGGTFLNDWALGAGEVSFDSSYNRIHNLDGVISGEGRIVAPDNANGVIRLRNTGNTFTGGLTILSGGQVFLDDGDVNMGPTVGGVFVADNIILKDGGMLQVRGGAGVGVVPSLNANRGITLQGTGGAIGSISGEITINGPITGDGPLSVVGGPVVLASTGNDYSGGTVVSGGVCLLGVNDTLPSGALVTLTGTTGSSILALNGFDQTIGGITSTGSNTRRLINGSPTTSTLMIDNSTDFILGSAFGFDAGTDDGNFNLVKNGVGKQELRQFQISGTTVINAGSLMIGNTVQVANSGDVTATSGSNFGVTGFGLNAESVTVESGATASIDFAVTDWAGSPQTEYTQIVTAGDFTVNSGAASYTVVIPGGAITSFSEANTDFTIATVVGTMATVTSDFVVDQSGFTAGAGTWSVNVVGQDVVLSYAASAGTPYDTWAGMFLDLSDTSFDLDFDNGGLDTGVEYVVGGDPTLGSDDAGLAPTVEDTNSDLLFTFRRSDLANDDPNTTIIVEYGSDLMGWETAVNGVVDVVIIENDDFYSVTPGIDQVIVSLPHALEVAGKLFARLRVVQP